MRAIAKDRNVFFLGKKGAIITGVIINVILTFLMEKLGIPLYLDCVGTIWVAAFCGYMPGVMTAILTNVIATAYRDNYLYFSLLSTVVAVFTSYIAEKGYMKKRRFFIVPYILIISFFCGFVGAAFQWLLLGDFQMTDVKEVALIMASKTGMPYALAGIISNTEVNLVDKGISAIAAMGIMRLIPEDIRIDVWNSGWKQNLGEFGKRKKISFDLKNIKGHIWSKTTLLIIIGAIAIAVAISGISISQYIESQREESRQIAERTAEFTAKMLKDCDFDAFIQQGSNAEGYLEAKELMYDIRKASPGIKYLYVMKVGSDAFYNVLDLNTEDGKMYEAGERIEFESVLRNKEAQLHRGEVIETIETNDEYGRLITSYYPVTGKNLDGVYYVGADASLEVLRTYSKTFILRILLIFPAFFILFLLFGITYADINLSSPMSSMVEWMENFMQNSDTQENIDSSVKKLRDVDIRTGDESEVLYKSICKMAVDTSNQVRDINYFANATAKMQNGLIITMADMVESRDSDTGAHVQKTAEYVRIIADSLKKNGYYLDKLTPKFMSDIVMSAPLHDVGKIGISDTVLNKPGKLTDEEYEIMKTHTTFGKEIMEKAIVTVKGENYLKEARNMAAYHHERWDGRGYPEGLHGEVIPLSARIMSVADVFDALTSPRVYKPAFPLSEALKILEEGSGTQFDPKCINAFMDALPEVKKVLKKYNNM